MTLPPMFAVWRPSLARWQILRVADSKIRVAWGPWISATHHLTTGRSAPTTEIRVGTLGERRIQFRYVGEHIAVKELDDRDVVLRRIPVLDFPCWRCLPRTCV